MIRSALAGLLVLSATAFAGTSYAADTEMGPDGCMAVAMAKHSQWTQDRVLIRETRTFADGSKKNYEAIFTESNSYGHEIGKPWLSMNIVRSTRNIQPVDMLERDMGLTGCEAAGRSPQVGGTASVIAFGYVPTPYFTNASGKIWISDATGLPVHQEYRQDGNADPKIAVAVTSDFFYGDDVKVPSDARRADEFRRFLATEDMGREQPGGGNNPLGATIGFSGGMGRHK